MIIIIVILTDQQRCVWKMGTVTWYLFFLCVHILLAFRIFLVILVLCFVRPTVILHSCTPYTLDVPVHHTRTSLSHQIRMHCWCIGGTALAVPYIRRGVLWFVVVLLWRPLPPLLSDFCFAFTCVVLIVGWNAMWMAKNRSTTSSVCALCVCVHAIVCFLCLFCGLTRVWHRTLTQPYFASPLSISTTTTISVRVHIYYSCRVRPN